MLPMGNALRHVNRQIEAAKVADILTPMGVIPETERQARELAPLVKADEAEAAKTVEVLGTMVP